MHREVEHRGADVGLPVSWLAVHAGRARDCGSGGVAAGGDRRLTPPVESSALLRCSLRLAATGLAAAGLAAGLAPGLARGHLAALLARFAETDRDRLFTAFHGGARAALQRAFLAPAHRRLHSFL